MVFLKVTELDLLKGWLKLTLNWKVGSHWPWPAERLDQTYLDLLKSWIKLTWPAERLDQTYLTCRKVGSNLLDLPKGWIKLTLTYWKVGSNWPWHKHRSLCTWCSCRWACKCCSPESSGGCWWRTLAVRPPSGFSAARPAPSWHQSLKNNATSAIKYKKIKHYFSP